MEYAFFRLSRGYIGIPLMGWCRFVPMPSRKTGTITWAGHSVPIIDLHEAIEGKSRADTFEGNLLVISTPHQIALLVDSECFPVRPESERTTYLNCGWLTALAQDHYDLYACR